MKKQDFTIGDSVRIVDSALSELIGQVGVVVASYINCSGGTSGYGIRLDNENRHCHNLHGLCEDHHGWFCRRGQLELIQEQVGAFTGDCLSILLEGVI